MPNIYDSRIDEAKQKQRMADLLRSQYANQPAGQMVSGWYVPNTGGAIAGAVANLIGGYQEGQAQDELKAIEHDRARDIANTYAQMGVKAPESLLRTAGTEEIKPSPIQRLAAFVRGNEAQTTPAVSYQQPELLKNITPEQYEAGIMNLGALSPEHANLASSLYSAKLARAKQAETEKMRNVPTGFNLNEKGELVGMPLAGGGDYAQYSMDKALAGQRYINPVEKQNMDVQLTQLGLSQAAANRADKAATRQEEAATRQEALANKQNQLKEWELQNPNANKNISEIQAAMADNERLQTSLKSYRDTLEKAKLSDIYNMANNAELQSAYQAALWPLRGENMMNTGVLNPGEMPMLNKALTDPSGLMGAFKGKQELLNQIDKVLEIANANTKAIAKSRLPEAPPGLESAPFYKKTKRFINDDIKQPQQSTSDGWSITPLDK